MNSARCGVVRKAPSVALPVRHRCRTVNVQANTFSAQVRPYTLRKGDNLASIAKKRGLTVEQVMSFNNDINLDDVKEGETILLPADKLSARDKEILDGIGTAYRLYPVRGGENLTDIMSKRGITDDEMLALNPGLDLAIAVKEHQVLKLPIDKFTIREREMLIGSGILPAEFFTVAKNPFVIGVGALMLVCGFVLAWMSFYKEEDEEEDEGQQETTKPIKS